MALQDLTPQLRTRLSRMERAVGWFVFLATALLLFGFGYYLYHTAERRGWFKIKAPFFTYVQSSAGLNVGEPVFMMGFPVGRITRIHAQPPGDRHNVLIELEIVEPYFRYLWTGGSYLKVNPAGFLDRRQIEVTRATNGYALVVTQPVFAFTNLDELRQKVSADPGHWQLSQEIRDADSNVVYKAYEWLTESNLTVIEQLQSANPGPTYAYNNQEKDRRHVVASWDGRYHHYKIFQPEDDSGWLRAVEQPPVSDQLQAMVTQLQGALPGILSLTNQLVSVLNNAANATSNLNATIVAAQPLVTNFAVISGELREPGGLGLWVLGTNSNVQVQGALTNLNLLLAHTDTNLDALSTSIGVSLVNLANITSNLNAQVQSNPNLVFGISKTIGDADRFVQGLKQFWLLRGTFRRQAEAEKKAAEQRSAGQKTESGKTQPPTKTK
jgi:ABC-type transporter Mla subunit MlaD